MRRTTRRRLYVQQRAMGLCLLLVSGLLLWLAYCGATPLDRDCTAVLLTAPLGAYLLTTKKLVIV